MEKYERPNMEIVDLEYDVITSSTCGCGGVDEPDENEPAMSGEDF